MEEYLAPNTTDQEMKDGDNGWTEVQEAAEDESPALINKEEVTLDETIHESTVGKGLGGALKDRGTLEETKWGGRNMDKKKSNIICIVHDDDGRPRYGINRIDEYGRTMTLKEAFRRLHLVWPSKFPRKMKQKNRTRQYQEEQMKTADRTSFSVSRMREAQGKLQTPYLVLSGNVEPGYASLFLYSSTGFYYELHNIHGLLNFIDNMDARLY